ncbi:SIMPL domain-containing protein [Flavobacterium sp. 83]|uniref:SIMPL domain-containing protein n=1 Tax=Flavobacterium sp. 83 TaxID=1131812 RepID=UPI000554D509|nr:SIMPL domain-containing protein [Flavobacterium sp. 83]
MSKQLSLIIVALILSLGLIISTTIFSYSYFNFEKEINSSHKQNSIVVVGFAEKNLLSDLAVLTGSINSENEIINFKKYLITQGIKLEEITFDKKYFKIQSEFVHKVDNLYKNISISQKYNVKFDRPQFFVKNTEEIKLSLLVSATKNARDKADIIAKSSNNKIGNLVSSDTEKVTYSNINSETEYINPNELDIFSKQKKIKMYIKQEYLFENRSLE